MEPEELRRTYPPTVPPTVSQQGKKIIRGRDWEGVRKLAIGQ